MFPDHFHWDWPWKSLASSGTEYPWSFGNRPGGNRWLGSPSFESLGRKLDYSPSADPGSNPGVLVSLGWPPHGNSQRSAVGQFWRSSPASSQARSEFPTQLLLQIRRDLLAVEAAILNEDLVRSRSR